MNLQAIDQISFSSRDGAAAEATDPRKTVERLKASRQAFLKKLGDDAKRTAVRWVQDEATYEEIKCVLWLKEAMSSSDAFSELEGNGLLTSVGEKIERISDMPTWSRTERWYEGFLDGVVFEWDKISSQVEDD